MQSLENFVEIIRAVFGGEGWYCKRLAEILLKTEKDASTFFQQYLGRNPYLINDLLDFREQKITYWAITFDRLQEMAYNNNDLNVVFENVFLQPFPRFTDDLKKRLLHNLQRIYDYFVDHPHENLMRYINTL